MWRAVVGAVIGVTDDGWSATVDNPLTRPAWGGVFWERAMRTQTPIEVDEGEIEVTGRTADVVHRHPRLALIQVDLGSKRAELLASGSGEAMAPVVMLQAAERTLGVVEQHRGIATNVHFPAWAGWSIAVASISRYTLVVCLSLEDDDESAAEA